MSWELESAKRPGFNRRAGSPFALIGFALGLLSISNGFFLFYWIFAPAAPLLLAGILAIGSLFAGKHAERVAHMADGAVAAAVFATTFAVAGFIVLAN